MLETYGWRGYFFITTDWIGRPGFLNEAQIRELRKRGHVIGSHSCSHPTNMSHLHWDQMIREWNSSTQMLSDILGEPVRVASVPGGYYSRKVGEAAASAGIEILFTSEPTVTTHAIRRCLVLGRYVIQRGMAPAWSAALAAGRCAPRWRQTIFWNFKKIVKVVGGDSYISWKNKLLSQR
jgi:peptidoglycan/xylan/chitin deacetylase (PgdA/CDA1 family)